MPSIVRCAYTTVYWYSGFVVYVFGPEMYMGSELKR